MSSLGRGCAIIVMTVAALALPGAAVSAAEADGCSGEVVSRSADGQELDRASAPGEGGTAADPLRVDPAGVVAWQGRTATVITDASWSVTVMGVPLLSGTFDNAEGRDSAEGTYDLASLPAPVRWALTGAMVIPVSGSVSGDGGTCTASGYVAGTGSPTSAPMFYAGIGLVGLAALLGVWTAAGTNTGSAAAAGAAGKVTP